MKDNKRRNKLRITVASLMAVLTLASVTGCGNTEITANEATPNSAVSATVSDDNEGTAEATEADDVLETKETESIEETTLQATEETTSSSVDKSSSSKTSSSKTTSSTSNKTSSSTNNTTSSSKPTTSNNTSSKTNNSTSSKPASSSSNKPASSSSTPKPSTATVAVSSVSLSKSSMNVTVGSSNSFTVTINPSNATNRTYTASTNNGNATVSCSGNTVTVKGQKAGSCVITVTSNNGKTAKCTVTVKAKVVTDDTPISHAELCTDKNMQKIVDAVVAHFKSKGMRYTTSRTYENGVIFNGVQYPDGTVLPFDKNHTGWFHTPTAWNMYDNSKSVNQVIAENIEYLEMEIAANLLGGPYNLDYSDYRFNYYYERESDGEYDIYFCYG